MAKKKGNKKINVVNIFINYDTRTERQRTEDMLYSIFPSLRPRWK